MRRVRLPISNFTAPSRILPAIVAGGLLAPALPANGDLTLNLTGSYNSAIVNWAVSGSITNPAGNGVNGANSSQDLLGIGANPSGFWTPVTNLPVSGDDIVNAPTGQLNLPFTGDWDILVNGGEISGAIDNFDLRTASFGVIIPDPLTIVAYPSLSGGEVISWAGGGTFTLSSGTYDTVFNVGTARYANAVDGDIVITTAAPIPEPGVLPLLVLGLTVVFLGCRKTTARLRC